MSSICKGDNSDLTEERKNATFDTDKMAAVIYGREEVRGANRLQITGSKRPNGV